MFRKTHINSGEANPRSGMCYLLQATILTNILPPCILAANAVRLFHQAHEIIAGVTKDVVIKVLIPLEPVIQVRIHTAITDPAQVGHVDGVAAILVAVITVDAIFNDVINLVIEKAVIHAEFREDVRLCVFTKCLPRHGLYNLREQEIGCVRIGKFSFRRREQGNGFHSLVKLRNAQVVFVFQFQVFTVRGFQRWQAFLVIGYAADMVNHLADGYLIPIIRQVRQITVDVCIHVELAFFGQQCDRCSGELLTQRPRTKN